MNFITIAFTRVRRLPKPLPMPDLRGTKAEATAFFSGWWHGIAVGAVIGAGLVVVILA